jgi:mannose-6-phosphate isomerase-like protein (cupin superfamily)
VRTHYKEVNPFVTKDGSEIRELMHPALHGNAQQSLAEATVAVGAHTQKHKHIKTEEIYFITQGVGLMCLGEQQFEVNEGDTVCIQPGTIHNIKNISEVPLKLLCCCSPPYSDADTELVES